MRRPWRHGLLVALLLLGACGGGLDDEGTDFAFQSVDWPASERFVVRLTDPQLIDALRDELARPLTQRQYFPNGRVHAGDGGHNSRWRWHLRDLRLASVSIEVCDGRPSMVEADLTYWIERVGRFCPWSARVVEEL